MVRPYVRLTVGIAIILPMLFALWAAHVHAHKTEEAYILHYAKGLLYISEQTADQVSIAAKEVGQIPPEHVCDDLGLDILRQIDLGSTLLQAVGYMKGNDLLCSSLAGPSRIHLGPAHMISTGGATFRIGVHFVETDAGFLVMGRDSVVGIIHPDLPLSFVELVPGMTLSIVCWSQQAPLMLRGSLDRTWLHEIPSGGEVFRDGERLVALLRSQRYDLGVVAAIPVALAPGFVWRSVLIFIPLGLATAIGSSLYITHAARRRVSLPHLIRAGLRQREFFLLYQPIVDLRSGRTIGAEALLRWRRPNGELIPPDVFISAAEGTELVHEISRYVFESMRKDIGHFPATFSNFHFGVNLSPEELHSAHTVVALRSFIADQHVRDIRLVVEATERRLLETQSARQAINDIHQMGIGIAIDDFGTGYANLAYLTQFEVDYLKIDKIFIGALATAAVTNAVVNRIVDIARDLNLLVIAEGVETEAQAQALRNLGVQLAQGWFYGHPMPIEALAQRVAAV